MHIITRSYASNGIIFAEYNVSFRVCLVKGGGSRIFNTILGTMAGCIKKVTTLWLEEKVIHNTVW